MKNDIVSLKTTRLDRAKKLFKQKPRLTMKQIAKKMNLNISTIGTYKRELGLTKPLTHNGKKLGRPKTNAIIKLGRTIKRIVIELG
jgi:hypothetical protein